MRRDQRLVHITSTTGDAVMTARPEVGDDVITALQPIVAAGGGPVPRTPDWYLDIWPGATGAAAFQVAPGPVSTEAGKRPYVMAVACWREEAAVAAWQQAREIAAIATPNHLATTPPPVPWLSVTLLPGLLTLPRWQIEMLGDFERVVFWTLFESEES